MTDGNLKLIKMNDIYLNILVEKILNEKPGFERLITSIINLIPDNTSKPSRNEVKKYLDNMRTKEKDFISAIKKKGKSIGDNGNAYIFSAIRKRAASHFINKGNKK
jgi:hypothetical protein